MTKVPMGEPRDKIAEQQLVVTRDVELRLRKRDALTYNDRAACRLADAAEIVQEIYERGGINRENRDRLMAALSATEFFDPQSALEKRQALLIKHLEEQVVTLEARNIRMQTAIDAIRRIK